MGRRCLIFSDGDNTEESIIAVTQINQQLYPEPYCSLVDTAPTVCYEESLLELWTR